MTQRRGSPLNYWPHLGIALSGLLTLAGVITGEERLIVAATNITAIAAIALGQRKRNGRDG